MTPEEVTIVRKCAAVICGMCERPDKWKPVRMEDGDYYHVRVGRFDDGSRWCDANAIWHRFIEAVPST